MGLDEYILGLLAIISGLAISEMANGLYRLLAHRQRIKWHWLTPVTAVFVAYYILASWWLSWLGYHGDTERVVLGWFLLPVGQLLCLVVAARAVLPDELPRDGEAPLDFENFYFSTKRFVWGTIAANSALIIITKALGLLLGYTGTLMGLTFPVMFFGLAYSLALALIDNRWFHRVAVPLRLAIVVWLTIGQAITN